MKRVLIVEDNPKAVALLKEILEDLDCRNEVDVALNLETAKQAVLNHEYDLFIVDIILDASDPSDASGLDFMDFIQSFKRYEFTPVVITSAVSEIKNRTYNDLDCYRYLEKPYDRERAAEILEKALRMPVVQEKKSFNLRCDSIVHSVDSQNVVAVYYEDRKITVQLVNGTLSTYYKTLTEICKKLPERDFIRCNKDTVINKSFFSMADRKKHIIYLKEPFGSVKVGPRYWKKVYRELLDD